MSQQTAIRPTSASIFDLSKTPVGNPYPLSYIKIIDNVFTPEECEQLIALAESGSEWQQAAVHYGVKPHQQYIDTEYRNSERILRFDHDASKSIYERLLPYIQDIRELRSEGQWKNIVGYDKFATGDVWKMVGVNERLSFLRYGPGHYFRQHCDGIQKLPDGRISYVTLQIYLNNHDQMEGGATRIHGNHEGQYYDVEPKQGRVLIFQQRGLLHSGEEVTKGIKYAVRSDFLFVKEK